MATAEPAPRPARLLRAWGLPATLLALGLAGAALLVLGDWIRERLILRDIGRIHALGEIESSVATAHVWIEEHVTGDEAHVGDVEEHLGRAAGLAAALLGDRPGARRHGVAVAPLAEPVLVQRAAELAAGIDVFTEVLRRRQDGLAAGEAVGIGSPLDEEQDRAFQRVIAAAGAIDAVIGDRMIESHRRSRLVFGFLLAAWVVIVALAVTGVAARERRRAEAEAALREREEELFRARKIEAVGRLAGGIAHDINNYLAAITAQCERVKMKAEPGGPLEERMGRVIETSFKASHLIKQLLAFTRRQPLRLRVLDLNRVVEGLVPMMHRLLGEDIRLEARLAPGLWRVKADPSQFEQVIVNLMVNAREAMPAGGRVTVETANRPAAGGDGSGVLGGDAVELAIADDGPGIDQAIRDKLFEPFFTTKEDRGGSGLGLATVYGIVTGAGGTVEVESTPGAGARFVIRLPRTFEEERPEPVPAAASAIGGREHVLLVDDNEDFRVSTRDSLTALGYRVTEAADGEAALAAFAYGDGVDVDVVISDVRMPGLSGPAAVDRMRQRRPGLKILFISGSSGSAILLQGFEPGEFDVLAKPFSVEELDRRIRGLVAGAPPAAVPPEDAAAGD
jgi:signal transduction histidine kinase/ActR/RegA family two-component response regulator